MNSGKGNRIVLCMGVVALAGVLSNGKTGMAVTKENPLITEAYKYIQGMARITKPGKSKGGASGKRRSTGRIAGFVFKDKRIRRHQSLCQCK